MSNSEPVVVDLTAQCPLTELTLVDSDFRTVAGGTGHVRAQVPAGLYELRADTGDGHHTEIIAVRGPADYVRDQIDAPFETVTPPADSTMADLVRTLHESTGGSATTSSVVIAADGSGLKHVELLDSASQALNGVGPWLDADDGSGAARAEVLAPGGYLLRVTLNESVHTLPFWLLPGFRTLVFLPWSGSGPDLGAAVVHIVPATVSWTPDRDRDVLLEALLQRLQTHRPALPDHLLDAVRRWADAPMLALAAAALTSGSDQSEAPALTEEAARLLPGHPDTTALQAAIGAEEPVSWPPMLAATYWRALLPADHAGASVIPAASHLFKIAVGLSWLGPYVTVPASGTDAGEWARTHLGSLGDIDGHPLHEAVQNREIRTVAEQTGLPLESARRAVDALLGESESAGRSWRKALRAALLAEPGANHVTVPGRLEWRIRDSTIRFTCDWDRQHGVVHAAALSDLLPHQFSLLLSYRDNVRHLARFVGGSASWPADAQDSYTVSVPEAEQIGDHLAFEALSLAPEPIATFSTADEPLRRVTTIADGRLRLATFQRTDHDLELTVRSRDRADEGRYAVLSVRVPGTADEEFVVPLTWLKSQSEASGAVLVGPPRTGATVFVVPELQHSGRLRPEMVLRSIDCAANGVTRRALRELYSQLAGEAP